MFAYIEKDGDCLNELEEESIPDMTKSCADDVSYYSGLTEYEPEIYEYLKEAEVCLCLVHIRSIYSRYSTDIYIHMSHDLGAVTIFRFSELGLGLGLG